MIYNNKETYLDTLSVREQLQGYASQKSKLTNLLKSSELVQVRRGLYVPGHDVFYSRKTLANKIYGPSYISFEAALAFHGLIPERVENITSATYNKNKTKTFQTPLGTFVYRCIPTSVYAFDIQRLKENEHPFLMASKEKALCDMLYLNRGIRNYKQLSQFLISDMRFVSEDLTQMDVHKIETWVPLYGKKVIVLFVKWIQKGI